MNLSKLFSDLLGAGYGWTAKTPDQLLSLRKTSEKFRPLDRFFGLGLSVSTDQLLADGLTSGLIAELGNPAPFAVSSDAAGGYLIHDHWPPRPENAAEYVHLGPESFYVAREIQKHAEAFSEKTVLDLGCGSGILSFFASTSSTRVIGIDSSSRATTFARDTAAARGIQNIEFIHARIGSDAADAVVGSDFDLAAFNPPLGVPSGEDTRPHRDGGKLGIEVPLLFLDFAKRHLKPGGEAWFICGNPIVGGKPLFLAELKFRTEWELLESRCLDPYFNQSVARKHGYAEQSITRIELLLIKTRRR
ncbi:MAG: methyltransferase [Deltaproteobacteria bacterium]|nr:methyltransferase [Deltaproteobacteria bacterium]